MDNIYIVKFDPCPPPLPPPLKGGRQGLLLLPNGQVLASLPLGEEARETKGKGRGCCARVDTTHLHLPFFIFFYKNKNNLSLA
jgi:hypothetical protein